MNFLKFTFSLISIFIITIPSFSQDSLQVRYDALMEKSETFQQYKVIPRTSLDEFWMETKDSLARSNKTIRDLNVSMAAQKDSTQKLNTKIDELQSSLDESLNRNDSISLLGIPFSKIGYHFLVWSIIIAVTVLGIIAYLMFLRSNSQTTRFRKDLELVKSEFETHKESSLTKQLKLKRELQTAINQLSEKR